MLRIYSDSSFTKAVETIEWNIKMIIKLVTGERISMPNTASGGKIAKANVYIRNESPYLFLIEDIILPDSRLLYTISSARLNPNGYVLLTVSFKVPEKVSPKDIIKAGQIQIKGQYVYLA